MTTLLQAIEAGCDYKTAVLLVLADNDEAILGLQREAAEAGDLAQELLCRDALREPHDQGPVALSARIACAKMLLAHVVPGHDPEAYAAMRPIDRENHHIHLMRFPETRQTGNDLTRAFFAAERARRGEVVR
jgi:hypothetical protein